MALHLSSMSLFSSLIKRQRKEILKCKSGLLRKLGNQSCLLRKVRTWWRTHGNNHTHALKLRSTYVHHVHELLKPGTMVISITFFKLKFYFSSIRVLKSKKKKLPLTFLYCLSQETWLNNSLKCIYINQSRFYNFFHVGKFKKINFEMS